MNNRVVITGQGVVSPIGLNVKEYYLGLKAGKNGISNITHFDTSKHNVKIAGEVNIDINKQLVIQDIINNICNRLLNLKKLSLKFGIVINDISDWEL